MHGPASAYEYACGQTVQSEKSSFAYQQGYYIGWDWKTLDLMGWKHLSRKGERTLVDGGAAEARPGLRL